MGRNGKTEKEKERNWKKREETGRNMKKQEETGKKSEKREDTAGRSIMWYISGIFPLNSYLKPQKIDKLFSLYNPVYFFYHHSIPVYT